MYISYFDESGDDGYPVFSSELFVLTSIYMYYTFWKENYNRIHQFRKSLKTNYNIPVKQEFHTKEFITDKSIYHGVYSPAQRKEILIHFCQLLADINIKCISVVIDKNKINRDKYDVMKNALTYNVQRIENDLNRISMGARFIIITDEGRVSKMRSTTRSIQKINYIPSMWNRGNYRKEIKDLIEDPLPKSSNQSYFIQLSDMISFIVSLYAKQNLCNPKLEWGKRIRSVLNYGDEIQLMNIIKPRMNIKASRSNDFGIVYYPK
ncbi:MAG: DUF3800 domain-containing protein [Bacteroidetes bacterium]|nr:DUF3800 domain-containing protein [Bacteroidota bacterium]